MQSIRLQVDASRNTCAHVTVLPLCLFDIDRVVCVSECIRVLHLGEADDGTLEPLPVLPTDSPATGHHVCQNKQNMSGGIVWFSHCPCHTAC